MGALRAVTGYPTTVEFIYLYDSALGHLRHVLRTGLASYAGDIAEFNDHSTHAEVIRAFDDAIELAKDKGQ
jgi:hypothetical protein